MSEILLHGGPPRAASLAAGAALLALLATPVAAAGPAERPAGEVVRSALSQGVIIPAGAATLGSDDAEKAFGYKIGGPAARKWRWFRHERRRTVRLPRYWMDLTLVTQARYGRFVRQTGHRRPTISREDYRRQGFLVHPYSEVAPLVWLSGTPPPGLADHPVTLVSVADAQAFCAWRGKIERRTCRLPSEDEWEKAARGTDGRYFPWGSRWGPERLNSAQAGPDRTTPVKSYPRGRSPYGLFDMAGNLFQWTSTPGKAGENILKGCSWDDAAGICRAAARHDRQVASRHILIGFRCACDLPAATSR